MLVVSAQETRTYDFAESGVSIEFPDKWTLLEDEDGFIQLATDGIDISVYDSVALETVFEFTEQITESVVVDGELLSGSITITVTSETTLSGIFGARYDTCNITTPLQFTAN